MRKPKQSSKLTPKEPVPELPPLASDDFDAAMRKALGIKPSELPPRPGKSPAVKPKGRPATRK